MKTSYDSQADVLYIVIAEGEIEESDEIAEGVIIDLDVEGNPLGLEILDASKLMGGQRKIETLLKAGEDKLKEFVALTLAKRFDQQEILYLIEELKKAKTG
ncbi:MAG TPA: DUF2283 domain-containing protein [Candidatus Hypogeohydataceae bacterium YC38]|nr:DUF2283 domain-containing protein [Candidatus Brocadiales bacterium]